MSHKIPSARYARRLGFIAAWLLAVAAALHPSSSDAASIGCTTKITDVAVSPWGTVTVRAQNLGWWYFCELDETATVYQQPNNQYALQIAPDVCRAYLASFLTAKTNQTDVSFQFDFGSSSAPSCADGFVGMWAAPNPFPYWIGFGG